MYTVQATSERVCNVQLKKGSPLGVTEENLKTTSFRLPSKAKGGREEGRSKGRELGKKEGRGRGKKCVHRPKQSAPGPELFRGNERAPPCPSTGTVISSVGCQSSKTKMGECIPVMEYDNP